MELPVLPAPIWIDTPFALHKMVELLSACPTLAVDTESNSLHAYREQVCLIQFSCPGKDYLVDPLTLSDLGALNAIFAEPGIEKVFHAAEYDLICLKRDFGFSFSNLFDTMVAGRILGRKAIGLAAMLESEFGISIDKHFQRADWGERPLRPAMLSYARFDTHFLIRLRDKLKAELIEQGRWVLAQEDFHRLCGGNNHGSANGHSPENGKEPCWRIPGSQDLDPRRVAVLRELCAYRENQGRVADLPVFKILSNQALLEIAQTCPNFVEELDLLPGLSHKQVQRHGKGLLAAVKRGLISPPPVKPASTRPDDQLTARADALRNWRKKTAKDLGVESDIVLPRDVLQAIAEADPKGLNDLAGVMASSPWRFEQFGPKILQILNH